MLLDIHTHRRYDQPFQAIEHVDPCSFSPEEGHYYSVGIHPWSLQADTAFPLEAFGQIARHPQVLAIGEAGLDRLIEAPFSLQLPIFEQQIKLSEACGKPLIIHAVKSESELLALRKRIAPAQPWIIHGFRGKRQQAEQLLRHGLYISFNDRFQPEALLSVPLERLFLETDDSPLPIHHLCNRIAELRRLPVEELCAALQSNATEVFLK
jgi:TatD DNase family protein